jgi:hypothetical protein
MCFRDEKNRFFFAAIFFVVKSSWKILFFPLFSGETERLLEDSIHFFTIKTGVFFMLHNIVWEWVKNFFAL